MSPARRPSASPARHCSKADKATQMRKQRTMSIWAIRARSQTITKVAHAKAASAAVRSSAIRLPIRRVSQTVPIPASTDGNRAVTAVISPSGHENRMINQKKSGGLSSLISPLRWVTNGWPSFHISRAPSACCGSSGAHRS